MGFGTTTRARWANAMPLRQRFALPDDMQPHGARDGDMEVENYAAAMAHYAESIDRHTDRAFPGWDADGRPVES